jgi:PAS domain S-box-containing protein
MVGRSWYDFGDPEWVARAKELEKRRATGVKEPHQFLFIHKGGRKVLTRIATTPLYDKDGNFDGALGVLSDLTRQKEAEDALELKNMLNVIAQSAGIGMSILNPDYTITWHNSLLEEWFGPLGKTRGRNCFEVFEHRDAVCSNCPAQITFQTGRIATAERSGIVTPAGADRIIALTTSPIRDASGNVIQVVEIAQDITERKQAEAEKAKLEAQFQQAQKMESVGRLAGGVAHDFNNMLQVILANTDMALGEIPPDSPLRESLQEVRNCAGRSADLTRQLLAFARRQTIAPAVLDLNETVGSMLKLLRRLIGDDIDLTWLPAQGLGLVKMDPTQVDQILANLCVNARDAIEGVGKVTIETANIVFDAAYCADHPGYVAGEYVRLTVSDNGCGMDKTTLPQIFEPFFTTKGLGEGTGLGLATVYGIVKQNHGFISVYSEPGHGTTFTLYLPRLAGEAIATGTTTAAEPPRSSGETVLLVEDEPAVLAIARIILVRLGYAVLTAGTPSEAIRLAGAHAGEIHLLITDVVMPEMNGLDLEKRLLSLHPKLKCLFMSGYTANVIAHHGVLKAGVNFIQKPFSLGDLAAKVRATLDENKP